MIPVARFSLFQTVRFLSKFATSATTVQHSETTPLLRHSLTLSQSLTRYILDELTRRRNQARTHSATAMTTRWNISPMALRGFLLPRRASFWLLLLVLGGCYLLLLRDSPSHSPSPSHHSAVLSHSPPRSGDTPPEDRAQSESRSQFEQLERHQRQAGSARGRQDVLASDTEQEADDKWSWNWAAAARGVKQKLGWLPGPNHDDDEDARLGDGASANAEDELPKNAFQAKYGSEGSAAHPANGRDAAVSTEQQEVVDNPEMAYHNHLEKEHSPHTYTKHSSTLTFDHIYVVSLPKRTDRRERMDKIARALGFKFTYIDAISRTMPVLGWIAERVAEIRQRKRPILASALGVPENEVGGMAVDSHWLRTADRRIGLHFPDLKTLDERWTLVNGKPVPEGEVHAVEDGGRIVDWMTYLERTEDLSTLRPSQTPLDIRELLHDPVEKLEARQINDAVLSTWFSQVNAWKQVVENGDASALILEDDIDLEWDIERIWPNIEQALPPTWEIVLLGHCWGHELSRR